MADRTQQDLENDIKNKLIALPSYPAIMPDCADFLLSQIDPANANDDVTQLFNEYFLRGPHKIFDGINNSYSEQTNVYGALSCDQIIFKSGTPPQTKSGGRVERSASSPLKDLVDFGCCLPCSCITLGGNRRLKKMTNATSPPPQPTPGAGIGRLLQPDVIWLFYFERMGIFKMLGAILDDFVYNGSYPIPADNVTALILEMMTRHFKTGSNSAFRDRATTYARCLAWQQSNNTDLAKVLTNSGFSRLFHRFIILALSHYADRRLSDAVKGIVTPLPSVATVTAIQDTIDLLKNAMESFLHGRNYYNTLNGIVWIVGAVDLIRRLSGTIGIPPSYTRLDQIIPAAYNILVEKKSINSSDPNRYKLHFECAHDARDVLIDIAGNAVDFTKQDEVKLWLNLVEDRIEGYRAAYLELTGIDFAKPEYRREGTLRIEQQI